MWCLVSGRFMSLFVFLLIYRLLHTFSELMLFEKLIGWFLVDHMLEEYNVTSGKFFLINEDYRLLVENLTILGKNVVVLTQSLTTSNFIQVNLVLLLITLFIYQQLPKYRMYLLVFICYSVSLQTVLIVNFNFFVSLIKTITIFFIFCLSLYLYFYILIIGSINRCSISKLKQVCIISFLKIVFCLLSFLIFILMLALTFCFFSYNTDNIFLELIVKVLAPYTYFYYFIKKYNLS